MPEPTIQVKVKPDEQYLRACLADQLRGIANDLRADHPMVRQDAEMKAQYAAGSAALRKLEEDGSSAS